MPSAVYVYTERIAFEVGSMAIAVGERPGPKVSFVGPFGSGKTSIIKRFLKGSFFIHPPTIGGSFFRHNMYSSGSVPVRLDIWDTAGVEQYRSLMPIYSRASAAIVVVCDVSDPPSIEEAKKIFTTIRDKEPDAIFYFVANKIDLPNPIDTLQSDVAKMQVEFYRTSALTGEGVADLFQGIADRVCGSVIKIVEHSDKKKCC
jgi:small GTP-binding protein